MKIQILGTGCPTCQKLTANVQQALHELQLEAELEKITDINEIISFGVMGTPGLVVNGAVKAVGKVPSIDEIKQILNP